MYFSHVIYVLFTCHMTWNQHVNNAWNIWNIHEICVFYVLGLKRLLAHLTFHMALTEAEEHVVALLRSPSVSGISGGGDTDAPPVSEPENG